MMFFTPERERAYGTTQGPERVRGDAVDEFIRDVGITRENYAASYDLVNFTGNALSAAEAREAAYDQRNAAIEKATGIRLDNPLRQKIDRATILDRMRRDGVVPGISMPNEVIATAYAENARAWDDRLREIAESNAERPDVLAAIGAGRPIEEDMRSLAQGAERRAAKALAEDTSRPWLKWGGYFAGAMVASLRDPVTWASMLFGGPGGSAGKSVVGAIARTALREGIVNAGGEAVVQPVIQNWRSQLGLESGIAEAAKDVAMAGAFGAVLGGGIEGVARGFSRSAPEAPTPRAPDEMPARAPEPPPAAPPAEPLIVRAMAGDDEALIAATREAGDALDPAALAAADALAADRLVRGFTPEGIAPAEHDRALVQAIRFAEDPDGQLPLLPFDPVPARADPPPLPDAASGQSFLYLKKPVTFEPVDARGLRADPATFQYKGGGDAAGVTERLRSVERWDNIASGKVVVWERADGTRFIADGHQRLGLAQRLLAEGREQKIELNGYVFREREGWTPQDVRPIAAKKNLQEGSGDVIDTARILREAPTILDGSVPTGSEHMRVARGLARLNDDAFGLVLNGRVAPAHAAVVGETLGDRGLHGAAMQMLAQAEDLTTQRARYMVADIARMPTRTEVQETLLGMLESTVPLVVERARVLDRAVGLLRKERSAFRTVLANADRLENAGNVIEGEGSAAAADAAANAIAAIERLALRAGPIGTMLDRAAMRLAEGERIGAVAEAFTREVSDLVEQRGIVALATEEAPPRPRMDNPVGPEAQAQAEALRLSPDDVLTAAEKRQVDEVVRVEDIVLGIRQCSLF